MARISSYDQDSTLNKLDKVLGTDSISGDTKNYTINSMLQLVNQEGLVEAFDGASFAFVDYVAAEDNPRGVINLNAGVASPANFSDINQIYISTVDKTGLSIAEYLNNSLNNQIKVSLKGNMNQFGIYEVTAIEDHDDGAYKRLTLTPRAHNGILTVQDDFFLSNYSAVFDQDFSDDSVTEFGDVSNAGSGRIITDDERTSLNNFTNNGLVHSDVVDNVTSTASDVPLSANQGKILKDLIDAINTLLTTDNVDLDTLQEVVDFIEANRETLNGLAISNIAGLQNALDSKQNTEAGKGLSANDFTDVLLNKLNNISANAEVNVNADWTAIQGTDAHILNKPTDLTDLSIHDVTELRDISSTGSGAIITSTERAKLSNIDVNTTNRTITDGTSSIVVPPANAEQNVNADWDATTGDAQILNKPTLAPSNAEPNVQADWNITDSSSDAFILNKPSLAPANAEQNVQADWDEADNTSDAFIQNKPDVAVTKAKVDAALGTGTADDTYFYQGDGTWASPASNISLGDLSDVRGDTTDPGTNEGYVLRWVPATDQWYGASLSLEQLYNVNTNQSNSVGKVLGVTSFNAGNSVNIYDAVEINTGYLGDFDIDTPENNQIIQYNSTSSHWENVTDLQLPGTLEFTTTEVTTPSFDNGIYVSTEDGHDIMHFRYHGHDLSIDYLTQVLPTGILNGGVLTKANNTQFTIAAGDGIINDLNKGANTDPHPEIIKISWTEQTITVSNLDTNNTEQLNSWIYVDNTGTVQQQSTAFTDAQKKSNIIIGSAIHSEGVVKFVKTFPHTGYNNASQMNEFAGIFGPMKKSGHKITANGANLSIDRAAGVSFALGRNYANDPENPSTVSDAAKTQCVIHRYYEDGSGGFVLDDGTSGAGYTTLDPGNYDDGSGTLASVSGGHFTVQRLYYFPGTPDIIVSYYGKDHYNSIDKAEKSYNLEDFTEAPNTSDQAIYVGAVIMAGNTTDLTDTSDAKFLTAGAFRGLAAVTVGGAIAGSALNDLSDVSIQSVANDEVLRYNSSTQQWENVSDSILPITLDTANDRVGINSTSPNVALEVKNTETTSTSKILSVQDNNDNERLVVRNDGRVGIGTSSPSYLLDVVGNTQISGTLYVESANNQVRLVDLDSSGHFSVGVNTNFQIRDVAGNTSPVTIQAGTPSNTLYIKSDGNIGIGTSSPSEELHIQSTSPGVRLQDSDGTNTFGRTHFSGSSLYFYSRNNTSNGNFIWAGSNGTANTEFMRINSDGNLGIGTGSPDDLLHIFNSSGDANLQIESTSTGGDARLKLKANSTGVSQIRFEDEADANVGLLTYSHSNNSMQFRTNDAERMRITNGGDVGIGTDLPTEKLDVNGNVNITGDLTATGETTLDTGLTGFLRADSGVVSTGTIDTIENNTTANHLPYWDGDSFEDSSIEFTAGGITGGTDFDLISTAVTEINPGLVVTDTVNITFATAQTIASGAVILQVTTELDSGDGTVIPVGTYNGTTSGNFNTSGISVTFTDNSSWTVGGSEIVISSTSAGTLNFGGTIGTAGTTVTGNFGIGTSSPAVSLDINDTDAVALPSGTTAQRPSSPAAGMFRYNTDDDQFEGYTTEWGAIAGSGGGSGEIVKKTFNGGVSAYVLDDTIADIDNVQVFVDGVYQYPSNYTVSGSTVTFITGSTPGSGTNNVHIVHNVTAPTLTEGAAMSTSANLVGDDTTTSFALGGSPRSSEHVMVFLEGVYQEKENYSISGSNIVFNTAPPDGYSIEVKYITGILDLTDVGQIVLDELLGNGTATYALSATPQSENYTNVYIEGVYQEKGTYNVSGSNIIFSSNVPSGYSIEVSTLKTIPASSVTQTTFETDTFTADGSTNNFTLVNGSPASKALTMVFIQGVYQAKSKYNLVSGEIQFTQGTPDEDDAIEVISISAINTASSPVTSVNGEVGAVTVQSKHSVSVIGADTNAVANTVYVFTASLTLTLPASPELGDSIKISNLSDVDTCVLGSNGNKIMDVAEDLTLDTASASFELIWSGSSKGWVIIGQ